MSGPGRLALETRLERKVSARITRDGMGVADVKILHPLGIDKKHH